MKLLCVFVIATYTFVGVAVWFGFEPGKFFISASSLVVVSTFFQHYGTRYNCTECETEFDELMARSVCSECGLINAKKPYLTPSYRRKMMSDFISRLRNELAISSEDDCTQFAKDIATACDEVERLKTERDDYVRELQSRTELEASLAESLKRIDQLEARLLANAWETKIR